MKPYLPPERKTRCLWEVASSKLPEPRAFHRYEQGPWGQYVMLRHGQKNWPAQILNQSLSGLGLLVPPPFDLPAGISVRVENEFLACTAVLAFVRFNGNGTVNIGLRLETP